MIRTLKDDSTKIKILVTTLDHINTFFLNVSTSVVKIKPLKLKLKK